MKFLRVVPAGEGYRAELAEGPRPLPAADEALIEVAASGVNRADLSQIAGRYPPPPGEPEILGLEVSGRLVETGRGRLRAARGRRPRAIRRRAARADPSGAGWPRPRARRGNSRGVPDGVSQSRRRRRGCRPADRFWCTPRPRASGSPRFRSRGSSERDAAGTTRSADKIPAITRAGAELAIDTGEELVRRGRRGTLGPRRRGCRPRPDRRGDARRRRPRPQDRAAASSSSRRCPARRRSSTSRGSWASAPVSSARRCARGRGRRRRGSWRGFGRRSCRVSRTGALSVAVDSVFPPSRAAEAFERMKANRNVGKILIDWSREAA